jgi:hypothetical protein
MAYEKMIGENISRILNKSPGNSYFSVLIVDSINIKTIANKVESLPGVHDVLLKNSDEIMKNIKKDLSVNKISIPKDLLKEDFHLFQVFLDRGIGDKSSKMIRKYIQRLVGDSEVFISDLQNSAQQKADSSMTFSFVHNGSFLLIGLFVLVYLVVLFSLLTNLKAKSFILESFQRKKNVFLRSFLTGLFTLSIFFFAALMNYSAKTFLYLGVWIALNLLFFILVKHTKVDRYSV